VIFTLDGMQVETEDDEHWVAPTAVLIGKVRLAHAVSVWWGAVLRGDNELISVGRGSNVQDGCLLHTDPGHPTTIGPYVTVGHMAVVHGCTIGEGSLVGIGAVILNGAVIGRNCLIGAKALISEGKQIPDNSLVMGVPGKIVGEVRPEQAARMRRGTERYIANWQRYRTGLKAAG
jgi:carbonic anhydrase/acetyltransferase-like protein (isoleucine patch superfamily)